jgi:deoxyribodipyrimidine photo-lyase
MSYFPAQYTDILNKIDAIDPVEYGRTRNYLHGAVTRLSPYVSRGVISTRVILKRILARGYELRHIEAFVKELCWRDYFQRVAQVKDPDKAIRQEQIRVNNYHIPSAIIEAKTGLIAIDAAIQELYETGYMHNHARMYTAFLTCNLAQSHWLQPARWMYYHLLDGDWASNAGSWQWVAGANSSKKYYANQENINKYSATLQQGTYLDTTYESLEMAEIPDVLKEATWPSLKTELPPTRIHDWQTDKPTFIYNYYQLDPLWHKGEPGNRVLLLDPILFERYPVSNKCMEFMLTLSQNIPGILIFTGSFDELCSAYSSATVYYKEHPLNIGYRGIEEPRDWICDDVSGYFPSFFSYWKKVEKRLRSDSFQ